MNIMSPVAGPAAPVARASAIIAAAHQLLALLERGQRIDNAGLNVPIDPEFRVGTMSLGWDTVAHELVVECFELTEEDAQAGTSADPDDDAVERDVLRTVLDAAGAREFARRAEQVVSAGRGDCPFCSLPLEPEGHLCPRANGVARA